MDKLQPLIKHHYWICFVLAVIFVVVGWWTASGAIAVATEERKKSVEDSFAKSTQNATDPNESWVVEAGKKNEAEAAAYKTASKELWKRQQTARQWPPLLAADMKGIDFGGEIKNTTTRDKWAFIYGDEIERLLEIVKPYKNGEGLVDVNSNRVTHKPYKSWKNGKPTSPEIWDNQEDIWLLRSLLTSIARVNEGATRITESQVRKIFALKLRGGDREAKPGGEGGGGGDPSMGGMGGMMSGMMAGGPEGEMAAGMGGGGTGSSATHPGTSFEGKSGSDILDEEFGPAGGGAAGGGGLSSMMMGGPASMEAGGYGGGEGGAAAEVKRYVDGGPDVELGYKTRGFVLEVLVRDEQLPNLLASLTNSDFPVEIVRVEINSASATGSPAGGNGGMTDMSSGMGGMGGMGMGGMGKGAIGMGGEDTGAAFSDLGGAGSLAGEEGMSSGMGAGMGMSGGGMGMPGGGMGMPGGGADVNTLAAAKGKLAYQAAMSDPLIVHVKIGGLMTLYQSAQEVEAQAAAEEAAATTEKADAPPEGSGAETTDVPAENQVDPAMTGSEIPAADGIAVGTTAEATSGAPEPDTAASAVTEPGTGESIPAGPEAGAGEAATPPATEPVSADPEMPAEPGSAPAGEGSPPTTAEPVPGSGSEPM